MDTLITRRLVEITFAPLDEVAGWLTRLGLEVEQREEGAVTVRNPYLNITTAILEKSDPITRAVCLAFAVAGQFWPAVMPNLLKEVNREWKLRQVSASPCPAAGQPPGEKNNRNRPRRKPSPMAEATFAGLYKK